MNSPLYRTADLRALEVAGARGLPPGTLMQRAGAAAAVFILQRHPRAQRIAVVCGPGNNGGDGYVCAVELARAGRDVTCIAVAPAVAADARAAAARWQGRTLDAVPATERFDTVVDALFGIGLARPLAGAFLDAVRWMNEGDASCIALDVPSGLDADTGAWVGGVEGAVAAATVTFLAAKPGLFTGDGIDASGEVVVESLGIDAGPSAITLNAPSQFEAVARRRPRNTHKGRFGDVVVVGGSAGMPGAPLLAARAALRLGAGRVHVDCIGGEVRVDPVAPELMFHAWSSVAAPHVTVIGCGLGDDASAQARLDAAWRSPQPCVIDADALNLIAARGTPPSTQSAARVLTPHPLEAARLLGTDAARVQSDRLAATATLAARFGAWVVLKGAGSVISAPDGRLWINPTGNPALASAGTGDVLAGMIGALLAQGYEAQAAVLAAVWLHGRAADDYGADLGLTAGDIVPLAARALARLRGFR